MPLDLIKLRLDLELDMPHLRKVIHETTLIIQGFLATLLQQALLRPASLGVRLDSLAYHLVLHVVRVPALGLLLIHRSHGYVLGSSTHDP